MPIANIFIVILSKAQGRALGKLFDCYKDLSRSPAATARMLKESRNTLESLVRMGFVAHDSKESPYSVKYPRDCIYYQITLDGRKVYPNVDVPS